MKRLSLTKVPRAGWLALAVAGVLLPLTVYSIVNDGVFELDGDATTSAGGGTADDWDRVAANNNSDHGSPSVFLTDSIPPNADTIFTGGGSKDERDISGSNSWAHTTGAPPDKNDLEHAFASAYYNSGGELMIYFGADRFSNSGDSAVGFWFFQDNVQANASGGFNGKHIPGDILVTSDFRNGGGVSVINVFEWVGGRNPLKLLASGAPAQPGAASAPSCLTIGNVDVACAIANRVPAIVPDPWPGSYSFKGGGNNGMFPVSTLFEGGINISRLLGTSTTCFSSFMAMSRTSASTTAQLKDFVLGRFPLCGISVSKSCNGATTISDDGAHFHNEFTVAVTNTGSGPVHNAAFTESVVLDGDNSCSLTQINGQNVSPVVLMKDSPQIIASQLPSQGVVTATVQCDTLQNGFANKVSAEAFALPVDNDPQTPLPLRLTTAIVDATPACGDYIIEGGLTLRKQCGNRYDESNVLITPAVTMDANLVTKVCVDITVGNDSPQRVNNILISDDVTLLNPPSVFSLEPKGKAGDSKTFKDLCYIPGYGDDVTETNPGKITFTDTASASGTGALTQATVLSSFDSATCALCPD